MDGHVVPAIGSLLTFVYSLIMMLGVLAGGIVLLVAVWRGMKAHESIAESLKRIADRPS